MKHSSTRSQSRVVNIQFAQLTPGCRIAVAKALVPPKAVLLLSDRSGYYRVISGLPSLRFPATKIAYSTTYALSFSVAALDNLVPDLSTESACNKWHVAEVR